MKWSLVDSCGLDVVQMTLAKIRAVHALKQLQHGSYGLTEASIRQASQHTFGAYLQFEPLKTPLSPSTAVFVISEDY